MNILLNWGAKNTGAKYRVKGADLESARKFLSGREEWGLFVGDFSYKWKGDAQSNVSLVRIEPKFTITMPSWPAYRNQPQQCKDEWDTMWRALGKHEDGHRDLFERGISQLLSKLEALEAATGREVDDFMEQARAEIQSEHDAYDTRTDYGKSRGVELSITEQCRSKPKGD